MVRIQSSQIHNLQQMEVVVAGPEDANQLIVIDGQFDCNLAAIATSNVVVTTKETFSVLVGPTFTRKQFVQANATASIAKARAGVTPGGFADWNINNVDADWDDESGQVELRIEAQADAFAASQTALILGFLFHVTILAAVPTA